MTDTMIITGNPVPSAAPEDRFDNSITLDNVANLAVDSVPNRTGSPIITLKGMNSRFDVSQVARAVGFRQAQDDRQAEFDAFIIAHGYTEIGDYDSGPLTLTRANQIFSKDGQFYKPGPGLALPYTTAQNWTLDKSRFVNIGDASLRSELFSRDPIFVEQHGAISGVLTASNGDAFRAAFAEAKARGRTRVYGLASIYAFQNDKLDIPDGITFEGAGVDHWDVKASWRPRKMEAGTTMLFCGTPTETMQIVNVSNMRVAGGVIANDAYPAEPFPGNQFYSLNDFTNGDSTGADPATPKNIRVAVNLGNNSRLEKCRVQLNYLGVDGYNSVELLPDYPEFTVSHKGLGDNYDIGVLTYNKMDTGLKGVQVVGYWRMAARAVIASNYDDARWYGGCVFHDDDVFFQGFYGFSCRSNDVHRITAIDATTVSVPWNASHTVPRSGKVWLGNTPCTYTSTALVGGMIVLSGFGGVDPSSKTAVGAECFFGTHPGFAISTVSNGSITGMNHFTNRRSYDTALTSPTANPGGCIEISGNPLRHIDFESVHFFDVDVIAFLHDTLHISFRNCDCEGQGFEGQVDKGARIIAGAAITDANANGAFPAGSTGGLTWDDTGSMGDGSIDMKPFRSSTRARFKDGTARYFMPSTMLWNAQGSWISPLETRRHYNSPLQIMTKGIDGASALEIVNPAFDRLMKIDGVSERIGFGTTNANASLHKLGATEATMRLQVTDPSAEPIFFLQNSLGTWDLKPTGSSKLYLRWQAGIRMQIDATSGALAPGAHDTADIGSAANSYRNGYFSRAIGQAAAKVPNGYFNQVFTDSGAVGTSDESLKMDIEAIPDNVLDAWSKVEYLQYRLKSSVEEKGAGARIHVGVMAQRVEAAFLQAGINPFEYGILCVEQWTAEYAPVIAIRDAVRQVEVGEGEDAHLVDEVYQEEYETGEVIKVTDGGSQYGVRYEQALVLESALSRRAMLRLEARLKALEA